MASFTQSGSYQFEVTLTDSGGLSTIGSVINVSVTVPHVLSAEFLYDTAPNTLAVTFDADMTGKFSTNSLSVLNTSVGGSVAFHPSGYSYDAGTHTATFTLSTTPLLDGNYHATLTAPGVLVGDSYASDFFALAGDANHDRVVDVSDLGVLATNWQSSGKTFAQGDFNYDGNVDVTTWGFWRPIGRNHSPPHRAFRWAWPSPVPRCRPPVPHRFAERTPGRQRW